MHRHDTSQWAARERDLWARVAAHRFEDAELPLDFTARLAREQGWRRDEARAAIEEYRRFCFLALVCEHAVTPSEAVDEVWHLHLTYTQDYWQTFCGEVLGQPLHHGPTRGLREDVRRHHDDYAETLASYEHYFGPCPERWWPGTRERFADARRWRRVDTSRYFVLPRPRLSARWLAPLTLAMFGAVIAPIAIAQSASPMELNGPQFLMLYLLLLVGTFIAASVWRGVLRHGDERGGAHQADALGIAYLLGGPQRALDAAAAEGLAQNHLYWNTDKRVLSKGEGHDRPRAELQPLLDALVGTPGTVYPPMARAATRDLEQRLKRHGLLLDDHVLSRARWLPALLPLALLIFGVAKIVIGISRDKPVLFLILLCVATVIATVVFLVKASARSRAGDRVIAQARTVHARAARAPTSRDLGMAVALVGTSALAGSAYASYYHARQPTPGNGSSSDSSSSSSSGCSSSSDSGGSSGCSSSSGCGGCGGGGGD